jgi:hypothetical protein
MTRKGAMLGLFCSVIVTYSVDDDEFGTCT